MSNQKNNTLLPLSIIIAGVLITAAIVFTRFSDGGTTAGALHAQAFFDSFIAEASIDSDEFRACLANRETLLAVQEDFDEVRAISAQAGTPFSLVVGPNGNALPVSGAVPLAAFEERVARVQAGEGEQLTGLRTTLADDHVRGNPATPVAIIEFSDFQCPFCARLHPTLSQLVAERPDEVHWIYRHLPLASHGQAVASAVAGECVASLAGNDAFWEYSDFIFANQHLLSQQPYRG